jgi:hypothetical protein
MGLAFAVNLSFLSFLEDPHLFWVDPFEIFVELSRVPKRPVSVDTTWDVVFLHLSM